jgi:predicted DNA-binding helix-hairpin-helix protein
LRTRHDFRGYLHLKLPPGVSHATVEAAARIADRLSINIEVPSAARQAQLDATRDWRRDVIVRLRWMRDLQQAGLIRAGIATQFVVGVAGESDRELLTSTAWLRSELGVGRVYYGAFRATPGTPMANADTTPAKRTQRLLQADWLLRHYGFAVDEIVQVGREQLPLAYDPKLAWAMHHPEYFPVEINRASYDQLLRIPGMGPLGVKRVLRLRTIGTLREPAHIAVLGAAVTRICDFVTFDGRFFGTGHSLRKARRLAQQPIAEQLTLF